MTASLQVSFNEDICREGGGRGKRALGIGNHVFDKNEGKQATRISTCSLINHKIRSRSSFRGRRTSSARMIASSYILFNEFYANFVNLLNNLFHQCVYINNYYYFFFNIIIEINVYNKIFSIYYILLYLFIYLFFLPRICHVPRGEISRF